MGWDNGKAVTLGAGSAKETVDLGRSSVCLWGIWALVCGVMPHLNSSTNHWGSHRGLPTPVISQSGLWVRARTPHGVSGHTISHRTPVFCRGEREWGWEPAFSRSGDYKQGSAKWAPEMQSHMVLNGKSRSQVVAVGPIFMVVSTCVGICAGWQDWPTSEPLWSACGLSHACATVQRPFSEMAEGSGAVNHVIAAGLLFSIPH